MMPRRPYIRIAFVALAFWAATFGIYVERDVQSMPCISSDNTDLADIPNSDRKLYLNAYVETPEITRLGIPHLFHYTSASSPYSLVVVGFVPADSGYREIRIEAVSVLNGTQPVTTKVVGLAKPLDEFPTTYGTVLCGSVGCGRLIGRGASVILVVRGTLISDDGDQPFERTLEMPIQASTYIYPGWAFVLLPMSA